MKNNSYTCIVCGNEFCSYNPNPTFCSRRCKGEGQSAGVDFNRAKSLYESGMIQEEVAIELGTTQKVIYNLFKRNDYEARIAAKRNQSGENNSTWKGNKATYAALHYRVEAQRGKPQECSVCERTDNGTCYEWANLTGNYWDVTDYSRMCRKCHRAYDKERTGSSKHVPKKAEK